MVQRLSNIIHKVETKADSLVLPYMRENMRGLGTFISDIRNCKSKEAEQKRINKELVHIRQKFKTDRTIDPYSRRKYIAKLLFISLLGHDVNFGHVEAGGLIGSTKYQDKQIGYLFLSVLYCDDDEINRMLMTSLVNDLQSSNPNFILLALQCFTFLINQKVVEEYGIILIKLIKAHSTNEAIMRTALLCYGAMFRASPDFLVRNTELNSYLIEMSNKNTSYGLMLQYVSVFFQASIISPAIFQPAIAHFVSSLKNLISNVNIDAVDNAYYQVASPWTQIKILQFLMLYSPIDTLYDQVQSICSEILKKRFEIGASNKVHHLNIRAAICFEAVNLVIHYKFNNAITEDTVKCLAAYLVGKDVNYRYLALEILTRMASNDTTIDLIKPFTDVILKVVTDERDTSVRLLAVDLIYLICNTNTVKIIIPELLKFLNSAEFSIRHELALKIAFISEKYVENHQWYLDTMMTLVQLAGNYISEDLWFRIVQILANVESMQSYAASKAFIMLQSTNTNETLIKLVSYILGEYGNMIANNPSSSPSIQLQLLLSVFYFVDPETKAIILTSMAKMYNLYPEIKDHILSFFQNDQIRCNIDIEIQQRVFEFIGLSNYPPEFIASVLEIMPPYSLPELSELLKKKIENATIKKQSANSLHRSKDETPSCQDLPVDQAPKTNKVTTTNLLDDLFTDDSQTYSVPRPGGPIEAIYTEVSNDTLKAPITKPKRISLFGLFNEYNQNSNELKKHIFNNTGNIYVDNLVTISMKSAYQAHIGRFELKIVANNSSDFTISRIEFLHQDGITMELLNKNIEYYESLNGLAMFNFQAALLDMIEDLPVLSFILNGSISIFVSLPIYLHKFIQPYDMNLKRFLSVWSSLVETNLISQIFITPKFSNSTADISEIISNVNFKILDGVDTNTQNVVASGIVNAANGDVGVVLKLELQARGRILTVRSSRPGIANIVSSALSAIL